MEYKRRYGFNFIPFHNPVDVNFWNIPSKSIIAGKNYIEILYTGRIGKGISTSMLDVARAVELLNKKGIDVRLKIQTKYIDNQVIKKLKKYSCVNFLDYIAYSELPGRISEADILIIPYDFESSNYEYIKYSIPTKLTEYMISSIPIILYSPEDSAISYYVKENKVAYSVNKKDFRKLANAIELINFNGTSFKVAFRPKS